MCESVSISNLYFSIASLYDVHLAFSYSFNNRTSKNSIHHSLLNFDLMLIGEIKKSIRQWDEKETTSFEF